MSAQRLLDLPRIDIEAADDRHVLLAVEDEQVAVLVDRADVPGVQPAVPERRRGFLGPVAVAAHDLRPARADFAGLVRPERPRAGLGIDDLHLGQRHRHADRALLADAVARIEGQHRAGFALAVALADGAAGRGFPAAHGFHRQCRRAGEAEPEAREIRRGERLVRHQADEQCRASREQRDAVRFDRAQRVFGAIALQDRKRAAAIGREQQPHGDGVGMISRRDDQDVLVGAGRQQGLALRHIGRHRAVGEIDALGTARRAAGVLQDGERVRLGKRRQRKALAGPSGQPRAGIDHDGPADAELGGKRADHVLQRGIADDRGRLRIRQDRTELVCRVGGIERNGLRPGGQDREGCNRGIDRIRHDQRDPPAANLSQRLGEPGDAGDVFPICQPLLAAAKRHALRRSVASRGQHVQHGRKDMRHRRRHGVKSWALARSACGLAVPGFVGHAALAQFVFLHLAALGARQLARRIRDSAAPRNRATAARKTRSARLR